MPMSILSFQSSLGGMRKMDKGAFALLGFLLIAVVSVTSMVILSRYESDAMMKVRSVCQRAYRCYGEDLQVHSGWVDSGNGTMSMACDCLNLTSGEFLSEQWGENMRGEPHV